MARLGLGLGLVLKYISTILKGSDQAPIFVDSPFIIVSVVIGICSPALPVLSIRLGLGLGLGWGHGCLNVETNPR